MLVQAVRHSPREYFFVPQAWRYLSTSNFTPLVTLSFEADLAAAGLEPRAFYAHQLVALAVAAILLFWYLASYAGEIPAFLGSAIFLVSPQAMVAARTLMVRHYVEGLVLALMALMLWRRGRNVSPLLNSVLAAVFYLLAMLAKEVYAPIPLLMLFESRARQEGWKRSSARLIPVAAAAAGYVIWRLRMLGSPGGYGAGPPKLAVIDLWRMTLAEAPPHASAAVAAAAIVLLIIALLRRLWISVTFVATLLVVILLPLLPVMSQLEPRHGFLPFVLVAAGISLALGVAGYRRLPPAVVAAIALIATLVAGQRVLRQVQAAARKSVAEGRYVWSARADDPILLAGSPGWYLGGLSELRSRQNRGPGPRFLLSDEALIVESFDLGKIVAPQDGGPPGPLPANRINRIRVDRTRLDPAAPISVDVRRRGPVLQWRLGPEPTVGWVFLTYPDYDEYLIPPVGQRTIPESTEKQFFRIMRRLADGSWTITPPLQLPAAGAVTSFVRPQSGVSL